MVDQVEDQQVDNQLSEEAVLNMLIEQGLDPVSHAAQLLRGGNYEVALVFHDLQSCGVNIDELVNETSFVVAEAVRALPDTTTGNEAPRFYRGLLTVTRDQLVTALRNVITASKDKTV